MSKSATAIKATQGKFKTTQNKLINRQDKNLSVKVLLELRSDPLKEMRKQMQLAGMARRIAEAKANA